MHHTPCMNMHGFEFSVSSHIAKRLRCTNDNLIQTILILWHIDSKSAKTLSCEQNNSKTRYDATTRPCRLSRLVQTWSFLQAPAGTDHQSAWRTGFCTITATQWRLPMGLIRSLRSSIGMTTQRRNDGDWISGLTWTLSYWISSLLWWKSVRLLLRSTKK